MKFYLMRHAQAAKGPELDITRPLTSIGEKQAKVIAKFLLTQTDKIAVILHSDMHRGQGTAEIMAPILNALTYQDPNVGPAAEPEDIWKALKKATAALDPDEEVLLISHGPAINKFSAYLLKSGEGDKFHFSHASVCHFDTTTPELYGHDNKGMEGRAGQPAYLHWMVTAKLANRVMKDDQDAVIEAAANLVDQVATLVEAPRGESLKHEKHLRIVAPLRKVIQGIAGKYFERQGLAIVKAVRKNIPAAIEKHAEARSTKSKKFAADLLPDSIEPLAFGISPAEESVWGQAIKDAITKAAGQLAADLKSDATVADDKVESYLADRSLSKLTGDWSDTTLDRLRGAVADSYSAGGTAAEIEKSLKDTVDSFSDQRAAMIAQTEVNDAYNYGRMQTALSAGMDEKAWDPDGEACEVCEGNVDDGWIDIDDVFSSGDDGPTAHPNCDCSLSFRSAA